VRSTAAQGANCIANASGTIELFKLDGAEKMVVNVSGLPANTEFDVFVIQVPDADFGLSWYQGDLQTEVAGRALRSSLAGSTSRPLSSHLRESPRPSFTLTRLYRMPMRIQRRLRFTHSTLDCGSTRRRMPKQRGAPTR
jgi:hypothetical protein